MPKLTKLKKRKRARKHGFLHRMRTTTGARTVAQRRRKKRVKLTT